MADLLPIDTASPARAELTPAGIARLNVPLAQLDLDLQALRLKRETEREARIRDGIRAEMAHLKYDADPDAFTRPFPYLRKGITTRLGGQS
ncbi:MULTISPECIES: hypothetical protein [unclassified Streptomyces]|uniref:hypothetical protein n=1 Tax=unclassified Streptomyces TaxID=2593676 RepID=UPI003322AEB0